MFTLELSGKDRELVAQAIMASVQDKMNLRTAAHHAGYGCACPEIDTAIQQMNDIYNRLKQSVRMIAGHVPKFSVGDKVVVINEGAIYQDYFDWFDEADPFTGHYDEDGFLSEGDTAEVFRIAPHTFYPDDPLLYGIRIGADVYIIQETGIARVEE